MLFTRVCDSRDDIERVKFCPVTCIRRVANLQHMYYQLDCTLHEVGLMVWNLAFFPMEVTTLNTFQISSLRAC